MDGSADWVKSSLSLSRYAFAHQPGLGRDHLLQSLQHVTFPRFLHAAVVAPPEAQPLRKPFPHCWGDGAERLQPGGRGVGLKAETGEPEDISCDLDFNTCCRREQRSRITLWLAVLRRRRSEGTRLTSVLVPGQDRPRPLTRFKGIACSALITATFLRTSLCLVARRLS